MEWKPCLSKPQDGIAFFDGITIETDKITDPRFNRVLPVLKEEQIFMCRQMTHALKPGQLVLDIGTGSGVFAIWAAKKGCRVVAIDKSQRAINVARQNIKSNGVGIRAFDQLEPGTVALIKTTVEEYEGNHSDSFDIIFLSPPYNPTYEKVSPALHASAGIDGQAIFEEWIRLIPGLLKEGGMCIGNQMTLSDGGESIHGLRKIREAYAKNNRECSIRYTHILEGTIDVGYFLSRMYSSFINGFANYFLTHTKPEEVQRYITDTAEKVSRKSGCETPQFAFIYYEIENTATNPAIRSINERYKIPDIAWQDRIQLHRDIVEHASQPDLIPSDSLFMRSGPVVDFQLSAKASAETQISEEKPWEKSPLHIANRWISRRGLVGQGTSNANGSALFDVLLVDTAPMYRDFISQERLRQESQVWLSENKGVYRQGAMSSILKGWQSNTIAQQKAMVGPFLHPHFIKSNVPEGWADIVCTTLYSNHFESSREVQEERLRGLIRESLKPVSHTEDSDRFRIYKDIGYTHSDLNSLRVSNIGSTNDRYIRRMKKRLRQSGFPLNDRSSKMNTHAVKLDLEICHEVMHERVHSIIENALDQDMNWSTLIGIPLSLAFSDTESGPLEVPSTYRGGIWIYAGSHSREWTLKHEEELLDLSRLLWMLYNGKYNVAAVEGTADRRVQEEASGIQHDIKHVISAVTDKWMVDPDHIVNGVTEAVDDILDRNNHPLAGKKWKVVPLPSIYEKAERMLMLWTGTNRPWDIFEKGKTPQTFEDLIRWSHEIAKMNMLPYAISKYNIDQDYEEVVKVQDLIRQYWCLGNINICTSLCGLRPHFATTPDVVNKKESINWMNITRVLVSCMGNSVIHGNPKGQIDIDVSKTDGKVSIAISNFTWKKTMDAKDCKLDFGYIRGLLSRESFSPFISEFKGQESIRIYARKLGGEVKFEPSEFKFMQNILIPAEELLINLT